MIRIVIKKYWLFLFIISISNIYSQSKLNSVVVTDTLKINLENHYEISSISIIPFSEKIRIGKHILNRNDYSFNYRESYFSLNDSLQYSLLDTLIISYRSVIVSLKKSYQKRRLVVRYDKTLHDSISILRTDLSFLSPESIFGSGIQKSGTIARGFTIGTNRDLKVTSGFRLQLSGKLSKDIDIVAALTDENSPIQPEGNTERLQELDKVFIQIKHPNAVGTFGDYELHKKIGEFGNINRKLQGLEVEANFNNAQGMIAIASSKGTFNSVKFNGQDGTQGPYRLYGKNNERNIIVIAGTERVYIDGQLMIRGENKDYVIEYGNAEITFTPNRLITSASRITVDYEYSSRQYQRSYFGSNLKTNFLNNKLKVAFSFAQEGDDKNNPIDLVLSDAEKKILEQAGDNKLSAVKSGVVLGAVDSLGVHRGAYTKVDTIINGKDFSYYIYNPGGDSSFYNAVFSFVGNRLGDYSRISFGNYKFVGIKQGSYLPLKFLPLPENKRTANVVIDAEPLKNLNVKIELAGSMWDKNRFSNLDDNDNNGYARSIILGLKPQPVSMLGLKLNKLGISFKDRFIDNRFTTLDRVNNIEFNRDYNVDSSTVGNEQLREINLQISPIDNLDFFGKYGFYKKGNNFSSDRYLGNINYNSKKFYGLNYNVDFVKSKSGINLTNWIKQLGDVFFTLGKIKSGIHIDIESKRNKLTMSDSLLEGSHNYSELSPYLEFNQFGGFTIQTEYSTRTELFPLNGILEKESVAETQKLKLSYHGIREFSTNLNVTIRNKNFTKRFKKTGKLDNQTILVRSQSRFNFWNRFADGTFYYETATEKASKLEKLFIKVPVGQGNYIYLGDLNNDGIAEEDEYAPTNVNGDFILSTIPSDQLFPIINLQLNTRWKITFNKLFKGRSLVSKIIKVISSETLFRVDEKNNTKNTKDIYLLHFSKFLNDSTTLRGSNQFQQDIYLFKNNREYSFRFRFNQQKKLTHFSSGLEKGYFRKRSLRLKTKLMKEINNQTDFINTTENVIAPGALNSSRKVNKNELLTDFSYRPVKNIEVGFKINIGQIEDKFPIVPTNLNLNSESLRITWSLARKGRLRAEIERTELTGASGNTSIPFEVTNGFSIGKNYIVRLNFDYRFANNLQATFNYEGRKTGSNKFIQTMRAEARAYF